LDPQKRLHIAIVSHYPGIGGAESSMLTFLRNMDPVRLTVTVVLTSQGPLSRQLETMHIPYRVIPLAPSLIGLKRGAGFSSLLSIGARFLSILRFAIRLSVYLRKNGFDLVLTNTVKAHLYGSLAARICGIPLVWRFHDVFSREDFSPVWMKCLRHFGDFFPKKILAVSQSSMNSLVKNGLREGKISVIFNAVDTGGFIPKNNSAEGIRREFHIQKGAKTVGCIGRILPQKGQKFFLESIPKVVQRFPETRFFVVGEVFRSDDPYLMELSEIVNANRISDRVVFAGFRTDVADILDCMDVVVFPSLSPESFGLSILEAMERGKPVIASDSEGVRELIRDRISGVLVEPGHPEQIADRLMDLFHDRRLYEMIGHNAREEAKRFTVKRYVNSMEAALREAALKG
jgi:glycosyltransferase involved in cell wall biosynthesis